MIILTEHQSARVQAHLAAAGIADTLRAEILDHLCCAIEARMEAGQSFESALETTLDSWPLRHLRQLHRKVYFTTKLQPMLFKLSTAAALLSGIFFFSPVPEPAAALEAFNPEAEAYTIPEFGPPMASPLAGVDMSKQLSSGFGMREHPLFKKKILHTGIDLKADIGTPVLATADGKVVFAGQDGKYGISVRLLHEDGYVTVYNHLNAHEVERGDLVVLGQPIGEVGNTGLSIGPHLHYEVLKDDVPVDPLALMDR